EVWGGALCLSQAERTLLELYDIQQRVHEDLPDVLASGVDERRNVVTATVMVVTPQLRREVEQRYGAEAVLPDGWLTPGARGGASSGWRHWTDAPDAPPRLVDRAHPTARPAEVVQGVGARGQVEPGTGPGGPRRPRLGGRREPGPQGVHRVVRPERRGGLLQQAREVPERFGYGGRVAAAHRRGEGGRGGGHPGTVPERPGRQGECQRVTGD